LDLGRYPALATASENFANAKQQEFVLYIVTAIREQIKYARIAKIKPIILQNKILKD
jgi:uncharacterized protein YdeI (YjbR/CyaY-like superfamily)